MHEIRHSSVEQFTNQVSSTEPAPGAGAAGAVALALAAACALKAVRISQLKKTENEVLWKAADQLSQIVSSALLLADADAQNFRTLMSKFRLPRDDSEAVQGRRRAIATAATECVSVGRSIEAQSRALQGIVADVTGHVNTSLLNDVRAARALVSACQHVQDNNIKANQLLIEKFGKP